MSDSGDKLLEDYLAGDSALSRRYRETLAEEKPSEHLDETIRAAARREVNARPTTLARASRRRTWYLPIASAAVLVLGLLLVLRTQQAPQLEERKRPSVATAPAAPEIAAASSAPAESAPAAQALPQRDPASRRERVAKREAAPAKLPPEQTRGEQRAATAPAGGERAASADVTNSAASSPAAAQAKHSDRVPAQSQKADAASRSTSEQSAKAAATTSLGGAASSEAGAEPVDGPPGIVTVPAAVPAEAAAGERLEAKPQRGDIAETQDRALDKSHPTDTQALDAEVRADPRRWLEQILRLQREARSPQVTEELRAFKQRYPEHVLPEQLADLWRRIQER